MALQGALLRSQSPINVGPLGYRSQAWEDRRKNAALLSFAPEGSWVASSLDAGWGHKISAIFKTPLKGIM